MDIPIPVGNILCPYTKCIGFKYLIYTFVPLQGYHEEFRNTKGKLANRRYINSAGNHIFTIILFSSVRPH